MAEHVTLGSGRGQTSIRGISIVYSVLLKAVHDIWATHLVLV